MRRALLANSAGYADPTVIEIDTDLGDGLPQMTFTFNSGYEPVLIDWGDGTVDNTTSHIYSSGGRYIVKLFVKINRYLSFRFYQNPDLLKPIFMRDWGNYAFIDSDFRDCVNLDLSSSDGVPNTKFIAEGNYIFFNVKTKYIKGVENWDFDSPLRLFHFFSGNTVYIGDFPSTSFANAYNMDSCFYNWSSFYKPITSPISVPSLIQLTSSFRGWSSYYGRIDLITSSSLTTINFAFHGGKFTAITISECVNVSETGNTFQNCSELVELILTNLSVSFDIRWSVNMPEQGYLDLIDSLADMTGKTAPTMTVKNNANWTSACDSAAALKNWNVTKV